MRAEDHLRIARWLSPAWPTGAFAWSHGLETAIAEGRVADAATLERWIAGVIGRGAGRTDAILLCAARDGDPGPVAELADALAPSAERRAETLGQGAAFAAALRAAEGIDLPDMPYPVALGAAAARAGLPAREVAEAFLQAMASTLVQAALRLMPLGQSAGAALLTRLAPLCAATAAEAVEAGPDGIGSAAMAVDIASMRHEATDGARLFRS